MPTGLTIFAAKDLVFLAAGLAAVLLARRLWSQTRLALVRWLLLAGIVLVVSYVLAQVGAAVYSDPRPFTTSHVPPLIPHAADNGFPSDHALLAAALVELVAFTDVLWSLPLAVLAILVDWARVGAGIHHVTDVVGSSVFVALASLLAVLVVPPLLRWLTPHLPADWWAKRLLPPARHAAEDPSTRKR